MGRLYERIAWIIEKEILSFTTGNISAGGFFQAIREEGYEGKNIIALVGRDFFGMKELAGRYLESRGFLVSYKDTLEDAGETEYKIEVEKFFRLKIRSGLRERKIRKNLVKKLSQPDSVLAESFN